MSLGLSNVNENHHGGRDQHYDDVDFCIGVMGHGKVSARAGVGGSKAGGSKAGE